MKVNFSKVYAHFKQWQAFQLFVINYGLRYCYSSNLLYLTVIFIVPFDFLHCRFPLLYYWGFSWFTLPHNSQPGRYCFRSERCSNWLNLHLFGKAVLIFSFGRVKDVKIVAYSFIRQFFFSMLGLKIRFCLLYRNSSSPLLHNPRNSMSLNCKRDTSCFLSGLVQTFFHKTGNKSGKCCSSIDCRLEFLALISKLLL
jgi:hypothetical protein